MPHGVVRQHTYHSKSLGRLRELAVYTPPGYDQKTRRTLSRRSISSTVPATTRPRGPTHGKAHWILDNLIAQGRAKPMVVVMMDGHAAVPARRSAIDEQHADVRA